MIQRYDLVVDDDAGDMWADDDGAWVLYSDVEEMARKAALWDGLMAIASKMWAEDGKQEAFIVPGFDGSRLWVISRQEYERMLENR